MMRYIISFLSATIELVFCAAIAYFLFVVFMYVAAAWFPGVFNAY